MTIRHRNAITYVNSGPASPATYSVEGVSLACYILPARSEVLIEDQIPSREVLGVFESQLQITLSGQAWVRVGSFSLSDLDLS